MQKFGTLGPSAAAREGGLQSFGLAVAVLEVDFSRSSYQVEIKILLYKSTSGNTKMTSEYLAKQKKFISEIPDYFSASEIQCISLIKFFCLARYSNSDAIFVFAEVDLYNRILISSQNSDLQFSTSSTTRPKL